MSISNRKPGEKKEAPAEPLKRVGRRLHARGRPEARPRGRLRVRPAGADGRQGAACPEPPRALDAGRMWRSCAATPIRWRCGSPATTPPSTAASRRRARRRAPSTTRSSRPASRRSARGGWRASRSNLSAMLEDRYHRGGKYEEITDRADAPIEDAVALMVRERLTGLKPPPAAAEDRRPVARLHRGPGRARSRRAPEEHRAPARLRPRRARPPLLPRHGRRGLPRSRGRRERGRERVRPGPAAAGEGESEQEAQGDRAEIEVSGGRQRRPGGGRHRGRATRPPARCPTRPTTRIRRRLPKRAGRRPRRANEPRGPDYKAFTQKFDEVDPRRGSLRSRRADAASRLSRQAARPSAGRRRAPRQPAAAAPARAAEPGLGVRPRGGHARSGAPAAHHHGPLPAALVQAREGHRFPRHRGDAAPRQFRLDARPADHGRGDLRRHPRAHARALRRQGRDPRLHHPRLEGRAGARAVAASRASPPIRAASTTCATSSTSRRTRPGGGRGRISA